MKSLTHTILAICTFAFIANAAAQTDTTFTYQGLLTENGTPVTTPCDLRFRLFDSASGGSQIGISQTMTEVPISDGRFTVQLDFGLNAFDNSDRWLDILYRCPAGVGSYLILTPRQPITRSPYSIQTRGIVVDENKNVGIGTDDPLDELHVAGDNATLRLEDTSTPGGFTLIKDNQPTQLRISKINPNGQVLFDMSPIPTDGTSNALVRFFRETDTDGIKRVQFLRGNLTTSPSASIGVDGENSYFQAHGGNVGIGVTNPLGGKLQVQSASELSAIDASSDNSGFPTIFAQNSANNGSVLWAVGNSDVTPTGGGVVVVGDQSTNNIAIDGNEIMARTGSGVAPLHLNTEGGEIRMGSHNIHPAFAYGKILETGTIVSASANITGVTLPSTDTAYLITVAGGFSSNDVVIATDAEGFEPHVIQTRIINGMLEIYCFGVGGSSWNTTDISFVVYRP